MGNGRRPESNAGLQHEKSSVKSRALIVRGGWQGHDPEGTTELFLPFLRANGFAVEVEESPSVYANPKLMAEIDLIVQCMTMAEISAAEVAGLRGAIVAGAGFTGWHGGIVDSFRASMEYLQLVGGQFVAHPGFGPDHPHVDGEESFVDYTVQITPLGRDHPITGGLDDFGLHTEQYWVLHDNLNDVLATTTHPARGWQPWSRPIISPAVWTRLWGSGRIVVSTVGHDVGAVTNPAVRTIIERGMLWASRTVLE